MGGVGRGVRGNRRGGRGGFGVGGAKDDPTDRRSPRVKAPPWRAYARQVETPVGAGAFPGADPAAAVVLRRHRARRARRAGIGGLRPRSARSVGEYDDARCRSADRRRSDGGRQDRRSRVAAVGRSDGPSGAGAGTVAGAEAGGRGGGRCREGRPSRWSAGLGGLAAPGAGGDRAVPGGGRRPPRAGADAADQGGQCGLPEAGRRPAPAQRRPRPSTRIPAPRAAARPAPPRGPGPPR